MPYLYLQRGMWSEFLGNKINTFRSEVLFFLLKIEKVACFYFSESNFTDMTLKSNYKTVFSTVLTDFYFMFGNMDIKLLASAQLTTIVKMTSQWRQQFHLT